MQPIPKFATVAIAVCAAAVAVVHFTISGEQARVREGARLQVRCVGLAAALNSHPEPEATKAILRALAAAEAIEAFVVADGDVVHWSAREEERRVPWSAVQGRLAAAWPGFRVITCRLRRDPAAPDKVTGALYLAAPPDEGPSAWLSAGLGAAAGTLLLLPLLLWHARRAADGAPDGPGRSQDEGTVTGPPTSAVHASPPTEPEAPPPGHAACAVLRASYHWMRGSASLAGMCPMDVLSLDGHEMVACLDEGATAGRELILRLPLAAGTLCTSGSVVAVFEREGCRVARVRLRDAAA